jgi:hypothetical protein
MTIRKNEIVERERGKMTIERNVIKIQDWHVADEREKQRAYLDLVVVLRRQRAKARQR